MQFLHTMIRVGDLEASIRFYTEVLGMEVQRRLDMEKGRFTLVFLAFPGEGEQGAQLELTYNWDTDSYDLGNGYGHLAISVEDMESSLAAVREKGGKIAREPKRLHEGGPLLAFLEDPDGYAIELIEGG